MKIGILSDSHGKAERMAAALEIFSDRGVDAIVHCGDAGSVECIAMLGVAGVAACAVAGNMDRRRKRAMAATAQRCGVAFSTSFVEVGGGQFLVATHGHDAALLDELIAGEQFLYVCHGHTHRVRDERVGKVRVINPGALAHPRDPRHPTVAILDTETDALEHIDLSR